MSKCITPEGQDSISNGLSLSTEALRKMNAVTSIALLTSVLPCLPLSLAAQTVQGNTTATTLSSVAPWVHKATRIGPADESKRVMVTAYLAWRNEQELEHLIQDQTTPGSPRYEQFLTPEQFHAAFSPKAEDVAAVENALATLGFKIENVPASGLFVQASGTVGQVKQAFQVSQNLYSYKGKILRSHAEEPSLPPSISGLVTYIDGLDDSRFLIRPTHVQGPTIANIQ